MNKLEENKLRKGLLEGKSDVVKSFREQLRPIVKVLVTDRGGTIVDVDEITNDAIIELITALRRNRIKEDTQSISYAYLIAKYRWMKRFRYQDRMLTKSVSPMEIIELEKAQEEKKDIVNPYKIARIKIDKNWTVKEFGKLLLDIDAIYQTKIFSTLTASINSKELNKYLSNYYKTQITSGFDLTVARVRYSSPGSIDIFGIGEILKQVKEFIFSSLEFKQKHKMNEIELEIKIEELRAKRLENVEKFLELTEKSKLPMTTMNRMAKFIDPKQADIVKLLESGKIKDIEIDESL